MRRNRSLPTRPSIAAGASGDAPGSRAPPADGRRPRALTRHDRRELRFFALGLAFVVVFVFWWLLPWLRDRTAPLWPLIVTWLLVVTAWAHPPAVLPIHRALLPLARAMAWLNTWLLLGLVFFAILLPVGWILRRLGKLQYATGFDRAADTYRVPVTPEHEPRLEEPF